MYSYINDGFVYVVLQTNITYFYQQTYVVIVYLYFRYVEEKFSIYENVNDIYMKCVL